MPFESFPDPVSNFVLIFFSDATMVSYGIQVPSVRIKKANDQKTDMKVKAKIVKQSSVRLLFQFMFFL